MIVSAPTSNGLRGIFRYDFAGNKPGELLAADQSTDVDGGLVSPVPVRFARQMGAQLVIAPDLAGSAVGCGALKHLDATHAEIKSMRTLPQFLRQGLAAALLDTIIAHARAEGLSTLSLETGSGPAFEPALALYRKRGFVNGAAFADYTLTDFNQCLHLALD